MRHSLVIRRDGACKSFPEGSASAQAMALGADVAFFALPPDDMPLHRPRSPEDT